MPVGCHGDLAGLKPPPFAVVDPHPLKIDGSLEHRLHQSALALRQLASGRVRAKHV